MTDHKIALARARAVVAAAYPQGRYAAAVYTVCDAGARLGEISTDDPTSHIDNSTENHDDTHPEARTRAGSSTEVIRPLLPVARPPPDRGSSA